MVDSNSNRDRDGAALDQPPAVSVIVPIYNGEADLPGLLAGLQGQDYPRDRVDYWLVDNGSRDRTPALLAAAAAQNIQFHALTYRDIQSSYAARNAGIQAATGQILAFTDADCQPEPSWLRELVRPFADPTVGLVAGGIHALSSQHWLERYAERQGTLSQTNTLNHSFLPYGQTANLAVRAEVFRQVGLFRPYLTTGGDADFAGGCSNRPPGNWPRRKGRWSVIVTVAPWMNCGDSGTAMVAPTAISTTCTGLT